MRALFLAVATVSGLLQSAQAVSGSTQCSRAMCISAIVHNNQTTSYDLTVTQSQVGWMALGFGQSMITSPLVILWKDTSNGNTIVSQRAATDFVMPSVVSSPNPVATPLSYRAASNATALTLSFVIPSTTETRQNLIWAWSKEAPSGNTPDANIVQHDDTGLFTISLTDPLPDSIDGPTSSGGGDGYGNGGTSTRAPTPTGTSNSNSDDDLSLISIPLTPSQRVFVAHGVFLTLAFMVILPLGALQARMFRTFVPGKWWFMAHWILQWPVTSVLIIVGFALGVNEVGKLKSGQFNSTHKKWGLVLVILYIVQCCYGGVIHFYKSTKATKRPPQNYGHAVLGLLIIALSFWQVYTGLDDEWQAIGGRYIPISIWTWWKVWVVMIPILYLVGLGLLPRQYRKESVQQSSRRSPISNLRVQYRV